MSETVWVIIILVAWLGSAFLFRAWARLHRPPAPTPPEPQPCRVCGELTGYTLRGMPIHPTCRKREIEGERERV